MGEKFTTRAGLKPVPTVPKLMVRQCGAPGSPRIYQSIPIIHAYNVRFMGLGFLDLTRQVQAIRGYPRVTHVGGFDLTRNAGRGRMSRPRRRPLLRRVSGASDMRPFVTCWFSWAWHSPQHLALRRPCPLFPCRVS